MFRAALAAAHWTGSVALGVPQRLSPTPRPETLPETGTRPHSDAAALPSTLTVASWFRTGNRPSPDLTLWDLRLPLKMHHFGGHHEEGFHLARSRGIRPLVNKMIKPMTSRY